MSRYHMRRSLAIFASLMIWIAGILQIIEALKPDLTGMPSPTFDDGKLYELDPDAIKQLWEYRTSQLYMDVGIDLCFAIGLLSLSYCVLCLKRVFKRYKGGESDLPSFMVGCFFVGAILPSIQVMESIGATAMASVLVRTPNYPVAGYQAVQVAHLIQQGSGIFLISCQFLFVSLGLAISSYLSLKTGELPAHHARMGAITSAVGFLVFIFEVVSVFSGVTRVVPIIFGLTTIVYALVLLPMWLVWLGVELVRLKKESKVARDAGDDDVFLRNPRL
eukprot:TRINITY_DN119_c0_g1_i1.p1 TRINITY_DN119_c0_g1~~TRINITY_DN119_c0_g1_i1.p1  ORF type:complete len:276 (+),score=31.23 TRINITY_DN119_c0_g1_i1:228-1055(+)